MTPIAKKGQTAEDAIWRVSQLKRPVRPKPEDVALDSRSLSEQGLARELGSISARANAAISTNGESGDEDRDNRDKLTYTTHALLPPQPQNDQAHSRAMDEQDSVDRKDWQCKFRPA